jgi:hypothetical protein
MIGLAGKAWMERDPDGRNSPFELRDPASRRVFTFDFPIKFTGHQAFDVQLGMAIVQIEGRVARWSTEDLVVAPWVRGGNIHGAFVEEILRRLIEDPPRAYDRVVVKFDGGATATESLRRPLGSDEGSRAYRAGLVRLYKSLGFKLCMKKTGDTVEQFLVRVL